MPRFYENDQDFHTLHTANVNAYYDLKSKVQLGEMMLALAEMRVSCPSVASFYLDTERHMEASDAKDADGNHVSEEEAQELDRIFHYREEDDFTEYIGYTVDVQTCIENWIKIMEDAKK